MALPDKILASQSHKTSCDMSFQPGGSMFSNGPLPPGPSGTDLPGSEAMRRSNAAQYGPASGYKSPTNMVGDNDDDEPVKLSTDEDEPEEAL